MSEQNSSQAPSIQRQSQSDRELNVPGAAANKEPGESSRETAGGITNRPLEQEQSSQAHVPPRGKPKEERHA